MLKVDAYLSEIDKLESDFNNFFSPPPVQLSFLDKLNQYPSNVFPSFTFFSVLLYCKIKY